MASTTYLHIQDEDSPIARVIALDGLLVRVGQGAQCEVCLEEPGLADVECVLRQRGSFWELQPVAWPGRVSVGGRPLSVARILPAGVEVEVGQYRLVLQREDETRGGPGSFDSPITVDADPDTDEEGCVVNAEVLSTVAAGASAENFDEPVTESEALVVARAVARESVHPSPRSTSPECAAIAAEPALVADWRDRLAERARWVQTRQAQRHWEARWRAIGARLKARAVPTVLRGTDVPLLPEPPASVPPVLPTIFNLQGFRAAWRDAQDSHHMPASESVRLRYTAPDVPRTSPFTTDWIGAHTSAKAPSRAPDSLKSARPAPCEPCELAEPPGPEEWAPIAPEPMDPPGRDRFNPRTLKRSGDARPKPADSDAQGRPGDQRAPSEPSKQATPGREKGHPEPQAKAAETPRKEKRSGPFLPAPALADSGATHLPVPGTQRAQPPADPAPPAGPGHETFPAVWKPPSDEPDHNWPSVRAILAAHPARTAGPATKALPSESQRKPVAGRPRPTVARAPEYWSLPVGALWAATVAAVVLLGAAMITLTCLWASDDGVAGPLADHFLRTSVPSGKQADAVPELASEPAADWWRTTPGHLFLYALAKNAAKDDPESAEKVSFYLHTAANASPLSARVRYAQALETARQESSPSLTDAIGLSRDVVSQTLLGRKLLEAGKTDAALRVYASAMDMAVRAELADLDPPTFREDPDHPRYRLPCEDLLAPIVGHLAEQRDIPFTRWSSLLPPHAVAPLATAEALRSRGRVEESDQAVALALSRASGPPPEGCSTALHLAAGAEALALKEQWAEAEVRYRQAIELVTIDVIRRSWWLNLADLYLRLNDDARKRLAWEYAKSTDAKDEVTQRAVALQKKAGLPFGIGPRPVSEPPALQGPATRQEVTDLPPPVSTPGAPKTASTAAAPPPTREQPIAELSPAPSAPKIADTGPPANAPAPAVAPQTKDLHPAPSNTPTVMPGRTAASTPTAANQARNAASTPGLGNTGRAAQAPAPVAKPSQKPQQKVTTTPRKVDPAVRPAAARTDDPLPKVPERKRIDLRALRAAQPSQR
ncbi:MAG TPA: hypothetical protein VGY53_02305 [Isosphaeraceae bacterium]|nr:hypothetical protein [Isosphaeraceae bacterium]